MRLEDGECDEVAVLDKLTLGRLPVWEGEAERTAVPVSVRVTEHVGV